MTEDTKPGYLKNCLIQPRGDVVLFAADQSGVCAFLDGYAVIPMENYERLLEISEEWAGLKIKSLA